MSQSDYEQNALDAAQLSQEFGARLRQQTELELRMRGQDEERSMRSERHNRLRARLGRRR